MSSSVNIPRDDPAILVRLYEIGLAFTTSFEQSKVLDLVVNSVLEVLRADIAVCYLYDQQTDIFVLAADAGAKRSPQLNRLPSSGGITQIIVNTRNAQISNNVSNDPGPYAGNKFTVAEGIQSVAGLPLKKGDEVVGVLYINYREPDMITERVFDIAEMLADQAAMAISTARLVESLSEREKALAKLVDAVRYVAEAIPKSHSSQQESAVKLVLTEIARAACELTGAQCCVFYPYNPYREDFYNTDSVGAWGLNTSLALKERPRSPQGMAAFVKKSRLVVRNDIEKEDPKMINSPFISREQIKAFAAVAVYLDDSYLGVLFVNFREPHLFKSDEIHIIELFANQAAIVLQIARLLSTEHNARLSLEKVDLLEHIGSALAHRVNSQLSLMTFDVDEIVTRLDYLQVQDEEIRSQLIGIKNDTNRLLQIIDSFTTLSELHGEASLIDVNSCVHSILEELLPASVKLVEHFDQDIPKTWEPKVQVEEVFRNIIRNAIEHMPSGGVLTIKTELSAVSAAPSIEISISDTGSGMDEETQMKAFDLLYAGPNSGGMGLGLWWSRTFMNQIGGEITVKSVLGSGCTFSVWLPVIMEEQD